MNLLDKLKPIGDMLVSPGSQFSLPALAVALCLAVAFLYIRRVRRRGRASVMTILRALFSRRVIFSKSTRGDLLYFFINTLALGGLIGWGLFSGQTVAKFEHDLLVQHFGPSVRLPAPEFVLRAVMTLLMFLAYEFGYWLDHYLKHKVPFLWELHKTHHSAEVLTPLTVFRVHPLDMLIFADILAVVMGLVAGFASYVIGPDTPAYALNGTNILLVAFLYAYVHLQHSQVWIPFIGAAGRMFMSPAHHQIHHSMDASHYNRNMGSCLAIWDWMFGTLEIPSMESPHLKFGVAQAGDDPHGIMQLLVTPIFNALGLKPPASKPMVAAIVPREASAS